MKHWNELDDSILFNKIFSYNVPIGEIILHSLRVDYLTSGISITFDIPEVPDLPPKKWTLQEFNTCQIGLKCLKINNLNIQYTYTEKPLTATIKKENNNYEITIKNDECQVLIEAGYIALNGPNVYLNGTE
jgi:hypothetical protein